MKNNKINIEFKVLFITNIVVLIFTLLFWLFASYYLDDLITKINSFVYFLYFSFCTLILLATTLLLGIINCCKKKEKIIRKKIIIMFIILIALHIMVLAFIIYPPKLNKDNSVSITETNVILNERQKEILQSMDLPTNYEELGYRQQTSIVAIEELLTYLEDKYGEEFCYLGYIPKQFMEEETLSAYPKEKSSLIDIVKVVRTKKDGVEEITDNYINSLLREPMQDIISEFFSGKVDSKNVGVFLTAGSDTLETIENLPDNIYGNVSVSAHIFIDGSVIDKTAYLALIEEFKIWLKQEKIYGNYQFILLKENVLHELTKYNYCEYLSFDYYTEREIIYTKYNEEEDILSILGE